MIKRPGPLIQMTMALVSLCAMLVVMADLFLGVVVDPDDQKRQIRARVAETLSVQVSALISSGNREEIKKTFDRVQIRFDDVRSLALRRSDNNIVLQSGNHKAHRTIRETRQSSEDQIIIPLKTSTSEWGQLEIAFSPAAGHLVTRWLKQPLVLTLMFLFTAGSLIFFLYMRRSLQHLDPSTVVPARVQGAFDAMSEGVVVLDLKGRVLLISKSFRELHSQAHALTPGNTLSNAPWLTPALPEDAAQHPWVKAMAESTDSVGQTIVVHDGQEQRHLVINCAPINDPGGNPRGCMVTFSDVSELHKSNTALRASMTALSDSKQKVQLQNKELQRLATRDPLTGCLNQRALHDAFDAIKMEREGQADASISCMMIDIDKFKSVNDIHGHAVGDQVIQEVARNLYQCVRSSDLVCRYGGEEFCILMKDTPIETALHIAERIRIQVMNNVGPDIESVEDMIVTVSLGVNIQTGGNFSITTLVDAADHALYEAKRTGRNRVCQAVETAVLAIETEHGGE